MKIEKIFLISICFIFLLADICRAQRCDEEGFMSKMDKNDIIYDSLSFVNCMRKNNCAVANEHLKNLREKHYAAYMYTVGVASAHGDCRKKNLHFARKTLYECSSKSKICKRALLDIDFANAKTNKDIKKLLPEIRNYAAKGDMYAVSMLCSHYSTVNTHEGRFNAYFWTLILRKMIAISSTRNPAITDPDPLVEQEIIRLSSLLDKKTKDKVQKLVQEWFLSNNDPLKPRTEQEQSPNEYDEEIQYISNIYNISLLKAGNK